MFKHQVFLKDVQERNNYLATQLSARSTDTGDDSRKGSNEMIESIVMKICELW